MAMSPRKPREVSIADSLWEVFSTIAENSSSVVDSLINQAMFEMAVRLGYVKPTARDAAQPMSEEDLAGAASGRSGPASSPVKLAPGKTSQTIPPRKPGAPASTAPAGLGPIDSKGSGSGSTPAAAPLGGGAGGPAGSGAIKRPPKPSPKGVGPAAGPVAGPKSDEKGLFVVNEEGDIEKIDKDIYIIGRSSKCDLVINSVKVSREHAIITRERGEYFIEDLGSANGTWYKGERIEKMKIKDSDEIFICDEKFKFVVR